MSSEPQEATEREHDEPNDAGFAGGATTPTPEPGEKEGFGEEIAVPAGDITGALMAAIDQSGHHDSGGDGPSRDGSSHDESDSDGRGSGERDSARRHDDEDG